ncbi:MAG: 3-deoxy-manno-octulosonate cytidylyltransferase, partial [Candidatus Hydrogenedentes bacterium]|nr:3-deoxy-manno-octulosonate cytidylyltransferase [Candidatus Hydrogenedentota bacterium]
MCKVIGIIPARYASTRLPGKALEDILGKPMIQRVYEACRKSEVLESLYVATDDERIATVVEKFGGTVIMTSPNHGSSTDRIAEAVVDLEADVIVN